ncbi:MAG: threonine ammonia-lyase, biosynthetic [Deltaproteobacteria bacterium]|nr:threonine ammonia-lyase, biosynthetic [Deltaproteobacteria bacterium]
MRPKLPTTNPFVRQVLSSRVYDVAQHTPLDFAKNLSKACGNSIYLKREDLQPIFSFKIRGAYNKISHLSAKQRQKGIICASAGNHAQGVAFSAQKLKIPAIIVMPRTTAEIKLNAVKQYGAKIILKGDTYTEAADYSLRLAKKMGKVFIHAFDDPLIIAGQGTIGHELIQDCPEMDYVFVPIGGGGLISGIARFIKALRPGVSIIGVEPEDSDAMSRSVSTGRRIRLKKVGTFADGVAVSQVGRLTLPLTRRFVDDFVTVSTDEICSAMKNIYEDTRTLVEPTGALAVAGLKKYSLNRKLKGKRLVAINTGANMNFDRLQFVAERTLTGEKKEALFAITIEEKPGALKDFCRRIIKDRNITEFNYRIMDRTAAHIFVGIGVNNEEAREKFCRLLKKQGFHFKDLTDNELAKNHIRHMVGGRSREAKNEVLYRFQFPERPKALANFLNKMSASWNISLFHYRSHGSDFGRVLVGLEIPKEDSKKFHHFLKLLNYSYTVETSNPAYQLFL